MIAQAVSVGKFYVEFHLMWILSNSTKSFMIIYSAQKKWSRFGRNTLAQRWKCFAYSLKMKLLFIMYATNWLAFLYQINLFYCKKSQLLTFGISIFKIYFFEFRSWEPHEEILSRCFFFISCIKIIKKMNRLNIDFIFFLLSILWIKVKKRH